MSTDTILYTKSVLIASNIQKIAHNCKFEHQWAAQCLGVETQGWVWDTMLAAHLADNRKGICGLKHQAYLNFGIENWGIDFEEDEDENDGSPLVNAQPTEELLRYNSLDAFWTWQLYQKQKALFK
jgi:DNA polymerase I-like protein with 3'-5' exonuclease and polymerase domains